MLAAVRATPRPSPSSSGWTRCRRSPGGARGADAGARRAASAAAASARPARDLAAGLRDAVAAAAARLPPAGRSVRGLFSGGTLCYEASWCSGGCWAGPLQRAARTRSRACPRPTGRARAARPRRGGVHPGRAPPDDRPERPARAAARPRATTPRSRWCCSTSCSGYGAHDGPGRPAGAGVRGADGRRRPAGRRLRARHRAGPAGLLAAAGRARGRPAASSPRQRARGLRARPRTGAAANPSWRRQGCEARRRSRSSRTPPSRAAAWCTPWRSPRRCTTRVAGQVVALGDPAAGFFRPVPRRSRSSPGRPRATRLEEKVAASIDRLADGTGRAVATRACCTPRTASGPSRRPGAGRRGTGHRGAHGAPRRRLHQPVLMDCQRAAILEPDACSW